MISAVIILYSFFLSLQAMLTLCWMLYFWEDPGNVEKYSSPDISFPPRTGFSVIIPARHEDQVIADTVRSIAAINYPKNLKQILVLCRMDDYPTIAAVQDCILELNQSNIILVTFFNGPINKPQALNIGLSQADQDFVCIFDAEDQPHPEILNIVNNTILRDNSDIVQSGVELMNYSSRWFSVFTSLEYYFWFKSGLPFFTRQGKVTFLGGNTVFYKRELLTSLGGWDNTNLTEDAEIGIRATAAGAKISLLYDERHITREESPDTAGALIRQRTRWNQGFLQTLFNWQWLKLPGLRSKISAVYLLLSPFVVLITFIYLPFGLYIAFSQKESILIAMFTYLPFYIFLFQMLINLYGLYQFSRKFYLSVPFYYYLRLPLFYIPYQFLLAVASFRAVLKQLSGSSVWEKTVHTNAHRRFAVTT